MKALILSCMCLIGFDCVSQIPMLRLKMSGVPNYLDETVLYYQEGATDGFDSDFDAYKISGPNSVPTISQEYNSVIMQINGISPVDSTFSIYIKTTTNVSGNFTITATDFAFLPAGTCVYLNDQLTGASVNILSNPYIFYLANTTTTARLVLVVTHFQLPIVSNITQPNCENLNAGKLKASGTTNAPWNYTWKDSVGTIIQSSLASFGSDSLINLNSGNYSVEVVSASNSCYSKETSFLINAMAVPVLSFTSPDTVVASIMQNYSTSNLSVNCQTYSWNFGDGIGSSTNFEPSYTYSIPGLYETKLIGTSLSGCIDSISKMIYVIDLATSLKNQSQQPIKVLSMNDNKFMIKLNQSTFDELDIDLYNIEGQKVLTEHYQNLTGEDFISLNFNKFSSGMYILNIKSQHANLNSTKIQIR